MADRRITTTIDGDLWHGLGILAAQLQTTKRALLEEALRDVLAKRGEKSMTKLGWEVIEDGGGGLHLFVFDGGEMVYAASEWELSPGVLREALADLRETGTVDGWEEYEWGEIDPQDVYDGLLRAIDQRLGGAHLIADQNGIYYDRMGAAGLKALGVHGTIIYATDADTVERVSGGYRWTWFEPEKGSELVPEAGAADHFEASGREDIAELIRSGAKYIYGRRL